MDKDDVYKFSYLDFPIYRVLRWGEGRGGRQHDYITVRFDNIYVVQCKFS